MKKSAIYKIIPYFSSVLFIIILWYLLALLINSSLILPPPVEVFKVAAKLCTSKVFWNNFLYTFYRVFISFFISVITGSLIGFFCGINKTVKTFFKIPVAIIRVSPVISVILIALFWFKSSTIPVFVSVLMTLPIMITSVSNGFENCNKNLLDMAKVYRFSKNQIIRYIKLPEAIPYFLTGTLSCFGLSWKVVVAGEVISLPKRAVGTVLSTSQVHLETANVIAATLILITASCILEGLFSLLIKKIIRKIKIQSKV